MRKSKARYSDAMLKPDISEFASWDGNHHPRDRRQHPIPSSLASELRLAAGNHQNHFAFEQAQFQPFERTCSSGVSSDSEILRHHAQSFTPTTDLSPYSLSALSTPSSISVHLPSKQPELPQDHGEVTLQDIPPHNRSMCPPEASSSRTINCENNPRIINGSSKSVIPAKDHPEVIDLTLSDDNVEEPILITIRDSSPLEWMEPLFTPPPTKKRARVLMDHVAVPALPKGITKAEYEPMFALPAPSAHLSRASVFDAPETVVSGNNTSLGKGKGKQRTDPPISISSPASVPRKKRKHAPAYLGEGVDTRGNVIIDAFCTHTVLPLANPEEESLPHWKAMITDARFTFTKQADRHMLASTPEVVDLVTKYHIQRPEGNYVDSQDVHAHVTSVGSDCMSLQERPAWELTPSCASPKITTADGNRHIEQTQPTSNSTLHYSDALESYSSRPSVAPPPDYPTAVSGALPDKGVAFGIDEDVDLNLYFNGLGDSPSKKLPAPCEDTFRSPFPGTLRFNEQHMGLSSFGGDGFFGVPPSPSCGDSGQLPASVSPSVFLTGHEDTPLDFHDSHSSSQWTLGNDIDSPRVGDVMISQESGTIDPSLLRGSAASEESTSKRKHQPRLSMPEPIVYVRRPQDVSGMRSGKKPVQIKFREQESPEDSGHHIEGISVVAPRSSMTKGQSPSDETQDDPDWVPSGPRVPSASKRNTKPRAPINMVESDLELSHPPLAAANVPSISLQSNGDKIRIRLKGPRPPGGVTHGIPNTAEKTFCHHCRNTTNRLKMRCSNDVGGGQACGKRFCQRCIEKRYPDITFDRFSRSFLCPFCTNTCNCSSCSRKRGEDYVSMRATSFTGPRIQPNVNAVQNRTSATPVSGDASTTAVSKPSAESNFWAHVYNLEEQHLGAAYREEPSPIPKPLEKRTPRVFIGRPLKSWKVRSVRDLEAMSDKVTTFMENLEKQGKGKGKGKAVESPLRLFIGNRAALHEPFGPMFSALSPASSRSPSPELGSENRLLQIPEAEGFWPQPDVGESCVWRPPPLLGLERGLSLPLSDEQVAKAIQVALAALS